MISLQYSNRTLLILTGRFFHFSDVVGLPAIRTAANIVLGYFRDHALNFLESLTHRWLIMARGRLIADATPHEIMTDENLMQRAGLMPTEAFQWKRLRTIVA